MENDSIKRFFDKVDKTPDCWNWNAGLTNQGYGAFWINGKTIPAHRFSYQLANGPINPDLLCCHKCDNRKCVNPEHIFLGTQMDNIRDMYSKNRQRKQYKTHCINGHPYTLENTLLNNGKRSCRICVRQIKLNYKARQRIKKQDLQPESH